MSVPQNYVQQENSYTFLDNENQRMVALMDYAWQFGGPVLFPFRRKATTKKIVEELVAKTSN